MYISISILFLSPSNNGNIFISIIALYGVLFENDEEAAFSNYRLWESTGFIIAFVLQTQVCIEAKLYVLLAGITAGMIGYFAIEINERRQKRWSNSRSVGP